MPMPVMDSSAPAPNSATAAPLMVRAPVTGNPNASPFTAPVGRSYGDQMVAFTPLILSSLRSRKLIRNPVMCGLSPIATPTSWTVRSSTWEQTGRGRTAASSADATNVAVRRNGI